MRLPDLALAGGVPVSFSRPSGPLSGFQFPPRAQAQCSGLFEGGVQVHSLSYSTVPDWGRDTAVTPALAGFSSVTPATSQSPSFCLGQGARKAEPEARVIYPKGKDHKGYKRALWGGARGWGVTADCRLWVRGQSGLLWKILSSPQMRVGCVPASLPSLPLWSRSTPQEPTLCLQACSLGSLGKSGPYHPESGEAFS